MAEKKENRGGSRPGSGRKPVPPDDVARMRRMIASNISERSIAKTLGYSRPTVNKYGTVNADDSDE
jgi:DNA invertase Pin-like site-specific DNA recombinase